MENLKDVFLFEKTKTRMLVIDYSVSLRRILLQPFWSKIRLEQIMYGRPQQIKYDQPYQYSIHSEREIIKVKTFSFDKAVDVLEVEAEMTKHGYRPATLRELLAFGKKFNFYLKEFMVISLQKFTLLGCDNDPYWYLVGLEQWEGEFPKSVIFYNHATWGPSCHFLGVRVK
jgi:hypothetical protein